MRADGDKITANELTRPIVTEFTRIFSIPTTEPDGSAGSVAPPGAAALAAPVIVSGSWFSLGKIDFKTFSNFQLGPDETDFSSETLDVLMDRVLSDRPDLLFWDSIIDTIHTYLIVYVRDTRFYEKWINGNELQAQLLFFAFFKKIFQYYITIDLPEKKIEFLGKASSFVSGISEKITVPVPSPRSFTAVKKTMEAVLSSKIHELRAERKAPDLNSEFKILMVGTKVYLTNMEKLFFQLLVAGETQIFGGTKYEFERDWVSKLTEFFSEYPDVNSAKEKIRTLMDSHYELKTTKKFVGGRETELKKTCKAVSINWEALLEIFSLPWLYNFYLHDKVSKTTVENGLHGTLVVSLAFAYSGENTKNLFDAIQQFINPYFEEQDLVPAVVGSSSAQRLQLPVLVGRPQASDCRGPSGALTSKWEAEAKQAVTERFETLLKLPPKNRSGLSHSMERFMRAKSVINDTPGKEFLGIPLRQVFFHPDVALFLTAPHQRAAAVEVQHWTQSTESDLFSIFPLKILSAIPMAHRDSFILLIPELSRLLRNITNFQAYLPRALDSVKSFGVSMAIPGQLKELTETFASYFNSAEEQLERLLNLIKISIQHLQTPVGSEDDLRLIFISDLEGIKKCILCCQRAYATAIKPRFSGIAATISACSETGASKESLKRIAALSVFSDIARMQEIKVVNVEACSVVYKHLEMIYKAVQLQDDEQLAIEPITRKDMRGAIASVADMFVDYGKKIYQLEADLAEKEQSYQLLLQKSVQEHSFQVEQRRSLELEDEKRASSEEFESACFAGTVPAAAAAAAAPAVAVAVTTRKLDVGSRAYIEDILTRANQKYCSFNLRKKSKIQDNDDKIKEVLQKLESVPEDKIFYKFLSIIKSKVESLVGRPGPFTYFVVFTLAMDFLERKRLTSEDLRSTNSAEACFLKGTHWDKKYCTEVVKKIIELQTKSSLSLRTESELEDQSTLAPPVTVSLERPTPFDVLLLPIEVSRAPLSPTARHSVPASFKPMDPAVAAQAAASQAGFFKPPSTMVEQNGAKDSLSCTAPGDQGMGEQRLTSIAAAPATLENTLVTVEEGVQSSSTVAGGAFAAVSISPVSTINRPLTEQEKDILSGLTHIAEEERISRPSRN